MDNLKMRTIDESIVVYKDQIKMAEKRRTKEEVKIIMDDKSIYHNLAELNNFITELKKSLAWYQKRKEDERNIRV